MKADTIQQLEEGLQAAKDVAAEVAAQEATTAGKLAAKFGDCKDTKSTLDALKVAVLELTDRVDALTPAKKGK